MINYKKFKRKNKKEKKSILIEIFFFNVSVGTIWE
jgi:hypothetical protein